MHESDKRAVNFFQADQRECVGNERWVRHYLYVDSGGGAKRLGKRLEREGFKVTVRRSGTGVKWLVLVSHRISVQESSIENFRELLEAAVEKLRVVSTMVGKQKFEWLTALPTDRMEHTGIRTVTKSSLLCLSQSLRRDKFSRLFRISIAQLRWVSI